MRSKSAAVVSSVVALLLVIMYVYGFVLNKPPEESGIGAAEGQESLPDLTFRRVTVEGRDGSDRLWSFAASEVEAESEGGISKAKEITDGCLYRDGQVYMGFTADRGDIDTRTGNMRLEGGVRLFDGGREVLSTDQLVWNAEAGEATLPGEALMNTEGGAVSANGLRLDVRGGEMRTDGDVIVKDAASGRNITIRGGTILFHPGDSRVESIGPTEIEFVIGDDDAG